MLNQPAPLYREISRNIAVYRYRIVRYRPLAHVSPLGVTRLSQRARIFRIKHGIPKLRKDLQGEHLY